VFSKENTGISLLVILLLVLLMPQTSISTSQQIDDRHILTLTSKNFNGLKNKVTETVDFMKENKIDILLGQETKLNSEEDKYQSVFFEDYKLYFNSLPQSKMREKYIEKKTKQINKKYKHNNNLRMKKIQELDDKQSGKTRGLVTAIRDSWVVKVLEDETDKDTVDYRYLGVFLDMGKKCVWGIYNVYAPNNLNENNNFFIKLKTHLQSVKEKFRKKGLQLYIIHGGDNNAIIDPILDKKTFQLNRKSSRKNFFGIKQYLNDTNALDSFRFMNKYSKKCSCIRFNNDKSKPLTVKSKTRIDHFIVPSNWSFKHVIWSAKIFNDNIGSDHRAILLQLQLSEPTKEIQKRTRPFVSRYKTSEYSNQNLVNIVHDFKCSTKLQSNFETLQALTNAHKINRNLIESVTEGMVSELKVFLDTQLRKTKKPHFSNNSYKDNKFINDYQVKQLKSSKKNIEDAMLIANKIISTKNINVPSNVDVQKIKKTVWSVSNTFLQQNTDYVSNSCIQQSDISILIDARKRVKNNIKQRIQAMKIKHSAKKFKYMLKLAKDNPKLLNKKLKQFFPSKQISTALKDPITGKLAYSISDKLRVRRNWWSQIYKSTRKKHYNSNFFLKNNIGQKKGKNTDKLSKQIMLDEIKFILKICKKFTTPGEDNVPIEIYMAFSDTQLQNLLILYNACFLANYIPRSWRQSIISEIPKPGDPKDMNNLRPISLINCIYKIYSNILTLRLSNYFESNNFFSELQGGFRKEHSCIDMIKVLTSIFEDSRQYKNDIHVLYIDIRKAFDSVEHWAIDDVLSIYDVPKNFKDSIMSLYNSRFNNYNLKAKISSIDGYTRLFDVERGVRQGDPLSPLLFIIFLNPLLEILQKQNLGYTLHGGNSDIPCLAYADDTVLVANSQTNMKKLLAKVLQYFHFYGIQINTKKSAYSFKTYSEKIVHNLAINGNNPKFLLSNESYKYLGMWVNIDLQWSFHKEQTVKKYLTYLHKLDIKRVSSEIKINAINYLLLPILQYSMNVVRYDEQILRMLDSKTLVAAKHAFNMHAGAKNEFIIKQKSDFGWALNMPSIVQAETLTNSLMNQTLNKQKNSLVFNALESRIHNSSFLQQTNQLNLNTDPVKMVVKSQKRKIMSNRENLTPDHLHKQPKIIHYKKDDMITSFVKMLGSLDIKIYNKHKHLFDIEEYIDCNNWRFIMQLVNSGIKTIDKLLDANKNLVSKKVLKEQILHINYNVSDYNYYLLQDIVSKFKSKVNVATNECENRDTFYIPLKDTYNLSQQTLDNNFYMVRFAGIHEIWVWTDGSLQNIDDNTYSGFGVFYNVNSNFNFHSVSTYKFENTNNELEAIRFALMQTPFQFSGINFGLRIFTDSKASVDLINNFPTWNSKKQLQCENKEILRHIQDIIYNIKIKGGNVKFELVPSHVLDENTHQLKVNLKQNKLNRVNGIRLKYGFKTHDILIGNEMADVLAKTGARMNKSKLPSICFPYKTDNYILTYKGKYVWGAVHRKVGNIVRQNLITNYKCLINKNNQAQIDFKTSAYIINKNLLSEDLDEFPFWINLRNFQTKIRSKALALRGEIFSRKSKKSYKYKGKYNSPLCIFCYKQGFQKVENTSHFLNECFYLQCLRQQTIDLINNHINWYSNSKVEKLFPFFFTNIPAVSTYKNLTMQQIHLLRLIETFDPKLGNCLFFPKALYLLLKSFYKENKKTNDNKWKPSPRSFANLIMIDLTKQFSLMYNVRNKGFHKFNKETFKEVDVFYKQDFNTNISNINKRNLLQSQVDQETDILSRGKYRKVIIDDVCKSPKRTLLSQTFSVHEEVEIRLVRNKKSKNKKRKIEKYSVDKVQLFNQNTGLT
jgi:ribonuclease HI